MSWKLGAVCCSAVPPPASAGDVITMALGEHADKRTQIKVLTSLSGIKSQFLVERPWSRMCVGVARPGGWAEAGSGGWRMWRRRRCGWRPGTRRRTPRADSSRTREWKSKKLVRYHQHQQSQTTATLLDLVSTVLTYISIIVIFRRILINPNYQYRDMETFDQRYCEWEEIV